MASEQETTVTTNAPSEGVLTGLAMLGGLGITLMVVAAGIGVVLPDVDSGLIGMIVLVGAGLLVTAIGGWVVLVQPHKDFDDITEPQYHGHQHEEDHSDHTDDDHAHAAG